MVYHPELFDMRKNAMGEWLTVKEDMAQRTRIWQTQTIGWYKMYEIGIRKDIETTNKIHKEEDEKMKLQEEEKNQKEEGDTTYCEKYELEMAEKIKQMKEDYKNGINQKKEDEIVQIMDTSEEEYEVMKITGTTDKTYHNLKIIKKENGKQDENNADKFERNKGECITYN